jgi:hypothetical protein
MLKPCKENPNISTRSIAAGHSIRFVPLTAKIDNCGALKFITPDNLLSKFSAEGKIAVFM